MTRRKTPTHKEMAAWNRSTLTDWATLFDAVGRKAETGNMFEINADAVLGAAADARKAIKYLEAGKTGEAVYYSMKASLAFSCYIVIGIHNWQEAHNMPLVEYATKIKNGKTRQAETTRAALQPAIDFALKLISCGTSKTDAQKQAAEKYDSSVTTLNRYWPK